MIQKQAKALIKKAPIFMRPLLKKKSRLEKIYLKKVSLSMKIKTIMRQLNGLKNVEKMEIV